MGDRVDRRDELALLGVQVAAIEPGFYLTGFNDTALEASSYWYDPETAVLPAWDGPCTLPGQEDPQPMIDKMVKVTTGESDRCRTVYPPSMEHEVREWIDAEWTKTV